MTTSSPRHVIVLHGLAMNKWWMFGVARMLRRDGYVVHSISYPSTRKSFEQIVDEHLVPLVESVPAEKISFVVHSMGGLLVRLYAQKYGEGKIDRVVMIGTPNHGSQVADFMKNWPVFKWGCGPAGQELGTHEGGICHRLGPVAFECGVIAGDLPWLHFPLYRMAGVPVPCDGMVSVESTQIAGMKDHVILSVDHTLMVWSGRVWKHVRRFLAEGIFNTI